jgi:hypothetical protein
LRAEVVSSREAFKMAGARFKLVGDKTMKEPEDSFSDIVTVLPAEDGGSELHFEVKVADLSNQELTRLVDWMMSYVRHLHSVPSTTRPAEETREPQLVAEGAKPAE